MLSEARSARTSEPLDARGACLMLEAEAAARGPGGDEGRIMMNEAQTWRSRGPRRRHHLRYSSWGSYVLILSVVISRLLTLFFILPPSSPMMPKQNLQQEFSRRPRVHIVGMPE